MKMIIIGGILTAALLFAVLSSIKADGPHWAGGGMLADRPLLGARLTRTGPDGARNRPCGRLAEPITTPPWRRTRRGRLSLLACDCPHRLRLLHLRERRLLSANGAGSRGGRTCTLASST